MIWLGIGFCLLFAVVYSSVFFGLVGSNRKKIQNRMDRRAAKVDYIRLARETDDANRRKKAEAEKPSAGADADKAQETPEH